MKCSIDNTTGQGIADLSALNTTKNHTIVKVATIDTATYADLAAIQTAYTGSGANKALIAFSDVAGLPRLLEITDGILPIDTEIEIVQGTTIVSNDDSNEYKWGSVNWVTSELQGHSQYATSDVAVFIVWGQSNAEGQSSTQFTSGLLNNVYTLEAGQRVFTMYDKKAGQNGQYYRNTQGANDPASAVGINWQDRIDLGEQLPDLYIIKVARSGNGISYDSSAPANDNRFYPFKEKSGSTGNFWNDHILGTSDDSTSAYEALRLILADGLRTIVKSGKRPRILGSISVIGEQDSKNENTATSFLTNHNQITSMIEETVKEKIKHFIVRLNSVAPQFTERTLLIDSQNQLIAQDGRFVGIFPELAGGNIFIGDGVHYTSATQTYMASVVLENTLDSGFFGTTSRFNEQELITQGVEEAPIDGKEYVRRDEAWSALAPSSILDYFPANYDIGTDLSLPNIVEIATTDNWNLHNELISGKKFFRFKSISSLVNAFSLYSSTAVKPDGGNGSIDIRVTSISNSWLIVATGRDEVRTNNTSQTGTSNYSMILHGDTNVVEFWNLHGGGSVGTKFKTVALSGLGASINGFFRNFRFSFEDNILSLSEISESGTVTVLASADIDTEDTTTANSGERYRTGSLGLNAGIGAGTGTANHAKVSNVYYEIFKFIPGFVNEISHHFKLAGNNIVQDDISKKVLFGSETDDSTGAKLQIHDGLSIDEVRQKSFRYEATYSNVASTVIPLYSTGLPAEYVKVPFANIAITGEKVSITNDGDFDVLEDLEAGIAALLEINIAKTVGVGTVGELVLIILLSTDDFTTSTPVPNSLREHTIQSGSDGKLLFNFLLNDLISAGTSFRIMLSNAGVADLSIIKPTQRSHNGDIVDGTNTRISLLY